MKVAKQYPNSGTEEPLFKKNRDSDAFCLNLVSTSLYNIQALCSYHSSFQE